MNAQALCVIGDAFFDIFVPTDGIKSSGAFNKSITTSAGGTANVAVWARRLGVASAFVGRVGDDPLGSYLKKHISVEKVLDFTTVDSENPTGVCVSLVDRNGERTMITNRGANDHWDPKDMAAITDVICCSAIVYTVGFSLISEGNSIILDSLMKKARANGCGVWFNPGAYNIINKRCRDFVRKYVDVLTINIEEAKEFTGEKGIDEIVSKLKSVVHTVILTMGEQGSIVSTYDEDIFTPSVSASQVTDSTGAGDAFAAGFLFGRMSGYNLAECSKLGHKLATEVIQRFGAS